MGQSASKAIDVAKRAAPSIAQAARMQRGTRTAAEVDEWKRAAAAATHPPNNTMDTRRSQRSQADTAAALAAAASSQPDDSATGDGAVPELPPDLIDFLNDAGPLQRTVDKERTSKRVYDALVTDNRARGEEGRQARQANARVRRRMPILAGQGGAAEGEDGEADDGTTTERTTNFSTAGRTPEAATFGVVREDLFRLAGEATRGLAVDSPRWKERMDHEYQALAPTADQTKDCDRLKDRALLENSVKYIGVPVLMKDSEGDIIGTWCHTAESLDHSLGMKLVPEGSTEFVYLTEAKVVADES